MLIIPAIDIIDGKCVRLEQGVYSAKTIYNENPLEIAKQFEDSGIKHLHLVDLDGAKQGKIINWKVLENIANNTNLIIDFGGGIKTDNDIKTVLNSGANQLTAGSIAVKDRAKVKAWLEQFGTEKIILGADVKNEMIAISGWQETSELNLFDFLEDYIKAGIKYSICTDISKDGMLVGSSIDLYKKIAVKFPKLNLVASGGVTSIEEVEQLNKMGMYGAIIGKAIYENRISLKELEKYVS